MTDRSAVLLATMIGRRCHRDDGGFRNGPARRLEHLRERPNRALSGAPAERSTRLDRAIRKAADDFGFIDLRPDQPGIDDPEARRFAVGRLQKLERMGLATSTGPGQWFVALDARGT